MGFDLAFPACLDLLRSRDTVAMAAVIMINISRVVTAEATMMPIIEPALSSLPLCSSLGLCPISKMSWYINNSSIIIII